MKNTSINTYLNLCTQVYELSKPAPSQDSYELYKSYAASANGIILEPMCGTGRFLLPLVAEGFNVHGFDGSQHMLNVLQSKAMSQKLKVNVWHGMIQDIQINKKYNLIFIPSGSFGLITDPQEAIYILKKFYDLLVNEGILVFEVETLKAAPAQLGIWRGSMWPREDGKFIIASFLDLPLENSIGSTICRYELADGNAIVETEIEILKVRLYDPETLQNILSNIGFTEIKMIKAFDRNKKPDDNDEVIVYECKKYLPK